MTLSVWLASSLKPDVGDAALALLVRGTGLLLGATLLLLARHAPRMFMSERWGGYIDPSPWRDRILRPEILWPVYAIWLVAAGALAFGQALLVASTIALLFSRLFFIGLRWQSASRGFGAPGFMTYWLCAATWVLLVTRAVAPAWQWLAVLMLQVDLAFIMLSAGIYKARSGYRRGRGMQFGMANPQWGYWPSYFRRWPADHAAFRALNLMAWCTEIAAAVLMVIPPTRQLGAWLIIASFVIIAALIRLGTLCWMVMLACAVFFFPGSIGDQLASAFVAPLPPSPSLPLAGAIIPFCLALYLAMLVPSHAGLWFNAYLRRRLPGAVQACVDRWTGFFGIIIWRVFSADHTEFFVRVFHVERDGRRELTRWGWPPWGRFNHVAESITLTSLVTWGKYFQSEALVHRRLVRVARTFGVHGAVAFRVVRLAPGGAGFDFQDLSEWVVDLDTGHVHEHALAHDPLGRDAAQTSIYKAERPGTYAPASR